MDKIARVHNSNAVCKECSSKGAEKNAFLNRGSPDGHWPRCLVCDYKKVSKVCRPCIPWIGWQLLLPQHGGAFNAAVATHVYRASHAQSCASPAQPCTCGAVHLYIPWGYEMVQGLKAQRLIPPRCPASSKLTSKHLHAAHPSTSVNSPCANPLELILCQAHWPGTRLYHGHSIHANKILQALLYLETGRLRRQQRREQAPQVGLARVLPRHCEECHVRQLLLTWCHISAARWRAASRPRQQQNLIWPPVRQFLHGTLALALHPVLSDSS